MPCVTEMNKCFIFFINIISVQVNQSALLNVLKIKINGKNTLSFEICLVVSRGIFRPWFVFFRSLLISKVFFILVFITSI